MRFKLVPEPPDATARLAEAQRAVPLVPGTEDDCCARLMRRLDFPSRDVARTWLTFLRALELIEERDAGFVRRAQDPTTEHLRRAFIDRVYGAQEVLDVLGPEPQDADAVFERFEERVPEWEHYKDPAGWRETWRGRVGRLLEWAVLLGLADRRQEGYVVSETAPSDGVEGSGGEDEDGTR